MDKNKKATLRIVIDAEDFFTPTEQKLIKYVPTFYGLFLRISKSTVSGNTRVVEFASRSHTKGYGVMVGAFNSTSPRLYKGVQTLQSLGVSRARGYLLKAYEDVSEVRQMRLPFKIVTSNHAFSLHLSSNELQMMLKDIGKTTPYLRKRPPGER